MQDILMNRGDEPPLSPRSRQIVLWRECAEFVWEAGREVWRLFGRRPAGVPCADLWYLVNVFTGGARGNAFPEPLEPPSDAFYGHP